MTCALPVTVPVVDFSACSLERDPERVTAEELRSLSAQLHDAFTRVGFVFLQNTGISQSEVQRVMGVSRHFFSLSEEQKSLYSRGRYEENANHGWVSLQAERLNPNRPGDLKESFNTTLLSPSVLWPTGGALSDFQQLKSSFFRRCSALGLQVLRLMPLSLGLEEETFVREHQRIGAPGNSTTLRSLFYPPIDPDSAKPGQLRCGEHSDYGSITLLFQSSPGIQVRSVSGQFLQVPLVPGAVLVNIADLMQRWTSDAFVSAVHRVLLPPAGDASERQSLAFFMQPDDSAVIGCCDGSDKYPPITSEQYLRERYADTY
uniref:Si:dkey-10o6.2 n=1 Tax=Neogobius melanostomus TaxID=47308 RepID=A0A8C6T0L1_9GOBI